MEANRCITTLVFRDKKKKIERTLEGFVQLQKGDTISLLSSLDDGQIKEGSYEVQEVWRIYTEIISGYLQIKYFLSRLNK